MSEKVVITLSVNNLTKFMVIEVYTLSCVYREGGMYDS